MVTMNDNWQYIEQNLSKVVGKSIRFTQIHSVGGGCINQSWHIIDQYKQHWFVKSNHIDLLAMFAAEFQGLEVLATANCIRVPKPIYYGTTSHHCYLIMEYISMSGRDQPCLAGEQLAKLHYVHAEQFGWVMDNTIGRTQQRNETHRQWVKFWKYQRLRFQLDLALHKGLSGHIYTRGFALSEQLAAFFTDYQPKASLLHGDLWSGNLAYDRHNQPIIFDPAVYYGDHETDLAMTELFGGFGENFYACYREHHPIDVGYKTRKTLYNRYHILNHFYLFGGGYGLQAGNMIEQLLSEINA